VEDPHDEPIGHHAPHLDLPTHRTRWLWIATGACAVLAVLAVLLLWPSGQDSFDDPLLLDADPVDAEVLGVDLVACTFSPLDRCTVARFELSGDEYRGEMGTIEAEAPGQLDAGDRIRVVWFDDIDGDRIYSLFDYQRDTPLLLLVALFAGAVVVFGRWRGLGALVGLAASLAILVWFTLPAILDGTDPVVVAVVSASVIALITLFLAHGPEPSTAVALLATLASLAITAVLASVFVSAARFTGMTDDSTFLLSGLAGGIDPRGILLAGIVIGALGVLDDVTVTQVSAVWQLKAVRPDLTAAELVGPALRIGRDHISSTVNTLFLAYAGTSLPLLLLFTSADQGFGDVITRELVATEVVRALVGSIGLVASVPISTWLAATVVAGVSPRGDDR
jgi:uncharacterized membrane protein